jgi:hypothetical protein
VTLSVNKKACNDWFVIFLLIIILLSRLIDFFFLGEKLYAAHITYCQGPRPSAGFGFEQLPADVCFKLSVWESAQDGSGGCSIKALSRLYQGSIKALPRCYVLGAEQLFTTHHTPHTTHTHYLRIFLCFNKEFVLVYFMNRSIGTICRLKKLRKKLKIQRETKTENTEENSVSCTHL